QDLAREIRAVGVDGEGTAHIFCPHSVSTFEDRHAVNVEGQHRAVPGDRARISLGANDPSIAIRISAHSRKSEALRPQSCFGNPMANYSPVLEERDRGEITA